MQAQNWRETPELLKSRRIFLLLWRILFTGVHRREANLNEATLETARVSDQQLARAQSLQFTILPDGTQRDCSLRSATFTGHGFIEACAVRVDDYCVSFQYRRNNTIGAKWVTRHRPPARE